MTDGTNKYDEGELNRTVLSAFDRAKISVVLLDSDIVPMPARSKWTS